MSIFKSQCVNMKSNSIVLLILISFSVVKNDYIYVDESEIPELRYMNTSVDPCIDFYEYTCGNFKNVKPRPDDQPIWDHFTILQHEIDATIRRVLLSKRVPFESKAVQKAKAFYTACTDVDYIDELKLAEKKVINDLGGFPLIGMDFDEEIISWEYIGDVISKFGINLFFEIQVGPNLFKAEENTIWLFKDKISNPKTIIDRMLDNYEDFLDFPSIEKREDKPIPFESFIRKIALKLKKEFDLYKNDEEIYRDIIEVIDYMKALNADPNVEGDEILPLSLTPTIKELQEWTDKQFGPNSGMNWLSFLNRVFRLSGVTLNENMKLMMTRVADVYGLIKLFNISDRRLIQNFILVRLLTYMAPDSSKYMRDAFETYYLQQEYPVYPRSEYCMRKAMGATGSIDFSMALAYEYQRYHFNINKLEAAAEMVSDLHEAFEQILDQAEWIDEVTRNKAKIKAQSMITLLGYPHFVEHLGELDEFYENLRICTWDHFGNSQRLRSFRQALQFRQIGSPRDRALWQNSPLEVNALYSRPNNRIVFPIGILDPVFFTGKISALDYGRIGAVIGHEITHGFDYSGKDYNENGSMGSLWSPETMQAFKTKIGCFVEQYSQHYIDEIEKYVNGTKTLDENLADNGGLREAFMAFRMLENKKSPMITVEGYTPEQLFFIGYGTMWCMQESKTYLEKMQSSGLYPPGRFRVRGAVSNNDYFAEVFQCKKGTPMNPEHKCILW